MVKKLQEIVQGSIPQKIIVVLAKEGEVEGKKVSPAFIVEEGNSKTLETALRWAKNKTGYVRTKDGNNWTPSPGKCEQVPAIDNIPKSGYRILDLEKRSEGGRAYKVVSKEGYYVDMREDVLLDTILGPGIKPGGELNAKYVWAKVGSQMKLVREGSELYDKLITQNKRKATKSLSGDELIYGHMYRNLKGEKFVFLGHVNGVDIKMDPPEDYYNYTKLEEKTFSITKITNLMLWKEIPSYQKKPFEDWSSYYMKITKSSSVIEYIGAPEQIFTFDKVVNKMKKELEKKLNEKNIARSIPEAYCQMSKFINMSLSSDKNVKIDKSYLTFFDNFRDNNSILKLKLEKEYHFK